MRVMMVWRQKGHVQVLEKNEKRKCKRERRKEGQGHREEAKGSSPVVHAL